MLPIYAVIIPPFHIYCWCYGLSSCSIQPWRAAIHSGCARNCFYLDNCFHGGFFVSTTEWNNLSASVMGLYLFFFTLLWNFEASAMFCLLVKCKTFHMPSGDDWACEQLHSEICSTQVSCFHLQRLCSLALSPRAIVLLFQMYSG